MKKIVQNSFGKGLNMDLNPLTTPRDVLTDCINGTVITYNGDEFSLQTEMGNTVVVVNSESTEDQTALPHGFIPIGMKEFNNILYIVAHNPLTKESRVGSFPSPRRYLPMHNDETENMVVKTITGTNNTSIQELTENLTAPGYISHGMNLLNSFLNKGDKFQVLIKIGDDSTTWTDAQRILERFINNFGTTTNGYFNLSYYTLNIDGNLVPLNFDITPNNTTKTSDVKYLPEPFTTPPYTNGVLTIYDRDGAGTIIAVLEPCIISKFDFKLQGFNLGSLKARVVFDSEMIDQSNSAIRISTIKVHVTSTESSDVSTKYYDFETHYDPNTETFDEEVVIDQLTDNVSTGFTEGTILTVTCTPIDQFGRELLTLAKTKTYKVTSILTGTEAHDLFQYQVSGTTLTLKYNFFNTGTTDITQTQVEFYDFWSGVSVVSPLINFTVDKEVTTTFTLSAANPRSTVFNEVTKGGIPVSTLSTPVSPERILGAYKTSAPLRKDHCYLVRIFGIESDIQYSVFQLLYTAEIPIFSTNYGLIRNFGTIDIATGLSNQLLDSVVSGDLFGGSPITTESTTPYTEGSSSNYTRPNGSPLEPYRLYGGPVFEEFGTTGIASWQSNNKFYRNIYTGGFARESDILSAVGCHNLPESSINSLSLQDGDTLSPTLFDSASKHYLKGGLKPASSNSQKDFKFNLQSVFKVVSPSIEGTVTLTPFSSSTPLLFGEIDMSILWKKVKLGNYVSEAVINLDKVYNLSSADITETLTWSAPFTSTISNTPSAKARIEVLTGIETDNVAIKDFSVTSQRQTVADSAFKYYVRSYYRSKLLSYFSLSNTQTIKAKLLVFPSDYTDITKHLDYMLYGSEDSNYDLQISDIGGVKTAKTKYSLVSAVDGTFDAELNWLSSMTIDIPLVIPTLGTTVFGLTVGSTSIIKSDVMPLSEKEITILSYAGPFNTTEQDVYTAYKSPDPVNFRVYTNNDSSGIYNYNDIWKWSNLTTPYIALDSTTSKSYLKNITLSQPYQEIIIAQHPSGTCIYNTSLSTTTAALTGNNIQYYAKNSGPEDQRHLTKSCFGSVTLEPFTVAKFSQIINDWMLVNAVNTRLVYDFTNVNLSEGFAKNIPWNYQDGLLSTVNMANLSMTMKTGSDPAHVTLFNNSVTSLLASTYMTSTTGSPVIKAIYNNQLVTPTIDCFTTSLSSSTDNINKSAIFVPKLNKDSLAGRYITFSTSQYGIYHKLVIPLSIADIVNGLNLTEGSKFGGGVIYALYRNAYGKVTGGKIVALEDTSRKDRWCNLTGIDCPGGADHAGATSLTNGELNTALMKGNCWISKFIMDTITDYRDLEYGFTDWYLPAQKEMEELVKSTAYAQQKFTLNTSNDYWTSTESSIHNSHAFMFRVYGPNNFHSETVFKNNDRSARAIRKF